MNGKLFNISKYLIFVTAIGQLAISQVHIGIITKVFNPAVGFYLFLFTIFGVLMAFNSSSFKSGQRTPLLIGGCITAVLTGILYINVLFKDIALGKLLTFEVAQSSIVLAAVTVVIYAVFTPILIISGYKNEK